MTNIKSDEFLERTRYVHFCLHLKLKAPAFAEKMCPISDPRGVPILILCVCCNSLPYLVNLVRFQNISRSCLRGRVEPPFKLEACPSISEDNRCTCPIVKFLGSDHCPLQTGKATAKKLRDEASTVMTQIP